MKPLSTATIMNIPIMKSIPTTGNTIIITTKSGKRSL